MVRGFITLLVVMAATSVVGAFAVLRGWSIFSDALGHGAIVGLLMAYLLAIDFYIGALLIGLFIALSVGTIERITRLRADVVIALTFTTMLALATVIISNIGGVNIALEDVLFADVTAVSNEMMFRAVGSALAIGFFVILFRRHLLLYSVDPMGAISLGIRTGVMHYLYLMLLAITTVSAFMSVGAIPAIAAIIIPPATAYLISKTPRQLMMRSLAIGVSSGIIGLYASYYLNINAGAATIMVSVVAFLIAVAYYQYRKPPVPEISR
jgi:iron/zinc/copper transport system permease protein